MEPRLRVLTDSLTSQKDTFYLGTLYPGEPITVTRPLSRDVLDCTMPNPKGNFRSPTGFWFDKTVKTAYVGSYSTYSYVSPTQWTQTRWQGSSGTYIDDYMTIPGGFALGPIINDVLEKIDAKIRDSSNLAVDGIQAKQTRDLLDYAKKGAELGIYGKKRLIKKAGELWLEYVYGWRPLMLSVYETTKVLTDKALGSGITITATSRRYERENTENMVRLYGWGSTTKYPSKVRIDRSTRVRMSMNINTSLASSVASRLTSYDPLVIAYELIPLSFIADWVYDIGGYLSLLEAAYKNQAQFQSGYQTVTNLVTATGKMRGTFQGPPPLTIGYDVDSNYRWASKNRTVLTKYPSPRKPTLDVNLGSSRMITAAALLSLTLPNKRK